MAKSIPSEETAIHGPGVGPGPRAPSRLAKFLDGPSSLGQSAWMLTLETLPHQIGPARSTRWWWRSPTCRADRSGKRVTGSFFLDSPAPGIEVCDYLLACDVDMEPLPGYRFANWETGYDDLNGARPPDVSALPGSRAALVLCDLLTLAAAGRGLPPPHPAPPDRAGRRPRAGGHLRHRTRVLPLPRLLPRGGRQALAGSRAPRRHHRGLPAPADDPGGVHHRPHPQPDVEAGIPIEFSKGEAGIGQHEINLTYGGALEVADRHWCSRTA